MTWWYLNRWKSRHTTCFCFLSHSRILISRLGAAAQQFHTFCMQNVLQSCVAAPNIDSYIQQSAFYLWLKTHSRVIYRKNQNFVTASTSSMWQPVKIYFRTRWCSFSSCVSVQRSLCGNFSLLTGRMEAATFVAALLRIEPPNDDFVEANGADSSISKWRISRII